MYISGDGGASSPLCRTSPIDADDRDPRRGAVPSRVRSTRWPTGSSSGNSCRAMVWLMTTTGGAVGPSSAVKPRPRSTGMPIAVK